MGIEIEVKFRVSDPAAMREALRAAGAKPAGEVLEHNTYFDTPDGELRADDCGLRIRTTQTPAGQTRHILTFKGPRREGPLKIRPEEEVSVETPGAAAAVLADLDYHRTLCFNKRRQSFQLGGARIELDELPELGFFLEIEADDERTLLAARDRLGLADEPTVTDTYIALVAEHLAGTDKTELAF